ncbi:TetR/AcrR family transcriptional regulator [Paraburkholderia sp. GAS448]|uniref:TetR/AcrR family transcriptional regulator n=1 Tax=Paraburkholderia sp. GAS448 TaxID=3035136 RepID=UPI003D1C4F9C
MLQTDELQPVPDTLQRGFGVIRKPGRNVGKTKEKAVEPLEEMAPRDRLIAAAVALFAQHGYDAVSTGNVATKAGLTQSMVHYHFGSKLKLWEAAIDHIMRKRGAVFPIGQFLNLADVDPLTRLKIMIRTFVSSNAADPDLNRILIHEGMQSTPRLKWLAKIYMSQGYQVFNDAIEEAMQAGLVRRLPVHEVTNIIVGACALTFSIGALLQAVYGSAVDDPASVASMADTLVTVLFRGLELSGAPSPGQA